MSVEYTTLPGSTAIPRVLDKRATVLKPSAKPETDDPAKVVTNPAAIIRMLVASPTRRASPSAASPKGKLKAADVAAPFAYDEAPLPASVETTPVCKLTALIRLFKVSNTKSVPFKNATPDGPLKNADKQGPSKNRCR